jgi:FAD/FMN-containing dehydrogenase
MAVMYVGDPDQGARIVQPLKDLGPEVDLIQPMPYTAFQAMLDPTAPPGRRNYWRGEYLTGLNDDAIETYLSHSIPPTSPFNQTIVFRIGQAVSGVGEDETAFSNRDARYLFHPICAWEDPSADDQHIAFARKFSDAMRPFGTGAAYLNFTPEDHRVRDGYGAAKYGRLVSLKNKYDPSNLFSMNQNIKPSRPAGEPALA